MCIYGLHINYKVAALLFLTLGIDTLGKVGDTVKQRSAVRLHCFSMYFGLSLSPIRFKFLVNLSSILIIKGKYFVKLNVHVRELS